MNQVMERQPTSSAEKVMAEDSTDIIQLLFIIFVEYLFRIFILIPVSIVKKYSTHPLSILFMFFFLFPFYLLTQCVIYAVKYAAKIISLPKSQPYLYILNVLFGRTNNRNDWVARENNTSHRHNTSNEDSDNDMQQWLERCSICFEAKLDLCLDYCRDQFCLECFQKYVSEVVAASWGLSVTKIRCPVCRIYIPQAEWTKFVPASTVELYNKFNRPYRSFSRCCPHCETEVIPCDFRKLNENCQSKVISGMIKDFFRTAGTRATTLEHRLLIPSLSYQQHLFRVFDRSEWRNSTLPDIHHQLVQALLCTCQIVDQTLASKAISKKILQLDMRPDTWRKLQFDHISFFSNIDCPTCSQNFCLQCGETSHQSLPCEENMYNLILQFEEKKTNEEFVQTLKWKIENSRKCPSCCIMINRDEGCNKVDCTLCGFSFCWECRNAWSENCSYFVCATKKNKVNPSPLQLEDEALDTTLTQSSSVNTAELGVPNLNVIYSRLNNSTR